MNIREIEISLIDVSDRLRSVNREYVQEIAHSFSEKGQLTPIEVHEADTNGRFRLVFGAHRFAAAQLLGWTVITGAIFVGTAAEARLREIDENLVRRELTALDRAAFLAERERLWLAANPASARGKAGAVARWHATDTVSFASDVAEKMGVTERTARRWLDLARMMQAVSTEARERIAGTRLADNPSFLKQIATLSPHRADEQMAALTLLLGGDATAPVSYLDAVDRVRGVAEREQKTAEERHYEAFTALWGRCSDEVKVRITDFIAQGARRKRARA